ncbi:MAG: hypothetical protein JSR77_11865 [Planctomycetes bacterium]|nr:hypothetical protein [Planctomycetota bacterium]
MRARPVDPAVTNLLDEAGTLPDCAARTALFERAALLAESFDDLGTAWNARCNILGSLSSMQAPRFENLFLCLAWCLAQSDRDPERFHASAVLWQYKWAVNAAAHYAQVPRSVLERLTLDLEARFVREGWGRRGALQKRVEVLMSLGDHDAAGKLLDEWRSTPRDRGSDCNACEADSLSSIHCTLGRDEQGFREARPIIQGRLSCSTVPHSTFGDLLLPLTRAGRRAQAKALFERGRRLVAAMENTGTKLSAPYLAFAAFLGDVPQTTAFLRSRLREAAALRSDADRLKWFGHAAVAMDLFAKSDTQHFDLPRVPGLVEEPGPVDRASLADRFTNIARLHAQALDRRNGNASCSTWLTGLRDQWLAL